MQNAYGLASGTRVENGGVDNVESNGVAVSTTINAGGAERVLLPGTSLDATVNSGGGLQIASGGQADNASVSNGASLYIYGGGSGVDTTLDGNQEVFAFGTASGTRVGSGGTDSVGGVEHDAVLSNGGQQEVAAGGMAISTVIFSGSEQTVEAGGMAGGTVVSNGGAELVDAGGADMGATVASLGTEYVYGDASGTAVENGATLTVEFGGTVTEYDKATLQGSVDDDGALIFDITSGATVAGTLNGAGTLLVQGGGKLTMSGGDDFTGAVTLNDAALELTSATAVGDGPIIFGSNGGLLRIDGTTMPANTISDFGVGDIIDLAGVSFDSNGSATGGRGSLLISENGSSYFLQLDQNIDYTGGTFSLLSGPNSATYIVSGTAPVIGSTSVGFGQSVSDAQVLNGGVVNVFSGGMTSGLSIYGGGNENVSSGGVDTSATVNDGGTQTVLSGGSASGTQVNDPGLQIVSAGGVATDVTLSGGEQDVYGQASATTIDDGGVQGIESGGVASNTTINSGGIELIGYGGVAHSTTINSGGIEYVNFGGTVQGTDASGSLLGGIAADTMVASGGTEFVSSGGVTISTTVSNGGEQDVFGSAVGTTLSGGAVQLVENGGVADGTVNAATEIVSVGGLDVSGTVTSGAYETISGMAIGTAVDGGGNVDIESGVLVENDGATLQGAVTDNGMLLFDLTTSGATFAGTLTGTGTLVFEGGGTLVMSGGDAFGGPVLLSGGTLELTSASAVGNGTIDFAQAHTGEATLQIDGTTMPTNTISGLGFGDIIDLAGVSFDSNGTATGSGSTLQISENGSAYSLQLDPTVDYTGATFSLFSDNQSGTYIVEGQALVTSSTVPSGQTLSNTQVLSGGTLGVLYGGTASGLAIDSGGSEYVSSGGTDIGTTINDGGYQYVLSGGVASNTVLNDPGIQIVVAGGSATSAMVSGGEQDVFGTTTATLVEIGGAQIVESGGTASGTIVESGGTATVLSGGVASGTTIDSGGFVLIYGTEISATISGHESVSSGGATISATVLGEQDVNGSGTASGTQIGSGGTQNVYGSAVDTVLGSGGTLNVLFGGTATGTMVASGGTANAGFEGTTIDTMVSGGGVQVVQGNGTASSTIVGSGGTESVSGGTDVGTTIERGGSEVVLDRGVASSTTISGGTEIVNFGGTAAGIVIASGGTAKILNGATVSGPITFATSVGALDIGGTSPALPSGTIGGLAVGDTIDLTDVAFVSGGTAFVSDGFLRVTENANTYALGLGAPASFPADQFVLSGDGGSGTDVTVSAAFLYVSSSSHTQTSTDLKAGGSVTITLNMSEHPVTVRGTPELALNDSGFAVYVASASKPASGTLVFKYTVSSGQNIADLQVTGVTSGGWSVTSGGHSADFGSYIHGASGDLGIAIDTNTPKIVSASVTPTSGGTVHLGQTVRIDLDLSDAPLVVTGTPTLKLSDGGSAQYVASASDPTSGVLEFDYTVTGGQSAADLKITSANLNGGSVKDLAGNAANLGLTTAQANLNVTVDGIPPTVTAVTAAASSSDVLSGGDIIIALKMSQPVSVTGSPVLTLNDGDTASYVTGSTTNLLIFTYTVGAESTADLKIIGIDQTSGTITDAASNELSATLSSNLNLAINANSWKVGSSGNFTTSADWTLGAPPTSSQEASISHAGTYTVSSTADATVAALNIGDKTATLAITSGSTFSTTSGTGVDASLGTIVVQNGATLDIGGTIINSGTIQLDLVGGSATLLIGSPGATLSGGGTVKMGGLDAFIGDTGVPATLTNVNNTIAGAGTIGDADLTLVNSGTINANNGAAPLTINTGANTVTNSGTLEATSAGHLVIDSNVNNSRTIEAVGTSATVTIASTISNTATALILASGTGAEVQLDGAVISGGTLRSIGTTAVIETVSDTTNTIAGATIVGGSLVEATSGSALTIIGGTIGAAAIVETTTSGTAVVSGTLTNSGTLFASGSGSVLKIANGAVVNGGVAEVGNGIVDIQGASSENVTFQAGGSGGLQLADDTADPTAYTGKVSGFGQNTHQFIDLPEIGSAGATLSYTSSSSDSGVLTVSSGGAAVAIIDLVGHYVTSNFHIGSGIGGSVEIIDPPVVAGGIQSANIALLGNYMASMFVTSAVHGGTLITDTQTPQQSLLTHPHA